jgi:uncharacterized protein
MSRRLLIAGFAALFLGGGLCPGVIVAQPASDDGLKAARELVIAIRSTDQFKRLLPTIFQALKPAFVQGRPQLEKEMDLILPIMLDSLNTRLDEIADEMASIYARNFTPDEIRDLVVFYRSPTGQKFIDKMPIVAKESVEIGQAWGRKIAGELQTRIAEELRKRGQQP